MKGSDPTLMPHFLTIRSALQEQIREGLLQPGGKLPAERKLAEAFNTTRITLREALVLLEAEGVIYREERRGWFVSPTRMDYDPGSRSHFHEMVKAQGLTPDTRSLSTETVPAHASLCRLMELPPLEPVHRIKRLRSIDGRPVLYAEHYLKPSLFPDILSQDLNGSMTELYRDKYGYQYGRLRFQIYPTALVGEAAEALNVGQGSQGLLIIRVNYDQNGQLLDADFEYWRHDAICITADING